MHFATIASGSSGNAILVGEGDKNLLVDCGVSAKSLLANLSYLGIAASCLEGIIVTHEHIDHIRGVGVLARKLNIPIYATAGIWEELAGTIGKLREDQKVEVKDRFGCAGLAIEIFSTSHDSRESYGVRIERQRQEGKTPLVVGIATDSGMITEEMNQHLTGCDALIVEANHDREKLWQGSYPWHLKKRISSNYGHLENSQLAEGLLSWIDENTQRLVLAHLSEENNTPELALSTVLRILRDSNIPKRNPRLRLRVAPRFSPHELIHLREE
ncbi:MAG: MBL fold metallo-hydrolase [Desulfitobacteriaceae bacterium]